MALCSLIAIFLIYLGLVDTSGGFTNISDLTGGAFQRDFGEDNSYIFPYNLGFVLTGSGKMNLLGFSFFRISGWAHEPTSATLFIAPAIILLLHTKIITNTFLRLSALFIVGAFWFFAMALGSIFAFVILYFLYTTSILFIKIFPLKLSLFLFFGVLTLVLLGFYLLDDLVNSSLIISKVDFNSETFQTAIRRLNFFHPNNAISQATSFNYIMVYAIMFFFFFNIVYSLFSQKEYNAYALVVLYILIHTMKGSQDSVFVLIFPFFWFYVLHFSIPNNQTKSVK